MVRHALTALLQRGEVSDPALGNTVISISEVRMSSDLKIATVFISPLGGDDPASIADALNRNARFIRGRVTPALRQMKYMPEFRFRADTSFDNYERIDKILRSPDVARDLGPEE